MFSSVRVRLTCWYTGVLACVLVLLAFSAYARGDGPLAGVALEAVLRGDGEHRMASMLDTALQMKQYARRIEARVAVEHTMPLANMSGMTEEERWVLGRWVETGAKVP